MLSAKFQCLNRRDGVGDAHGMRGYSIVRFEPFDSPFIQTASIEKPSDTTLFVSEVGGFQNSGGGPVWTGGFGSSSRQAVEVTVVQVPAAMIRIRRTSVPGVPLYVSFNNGSLVISWRYEEAVRNIARPEADAEAARIYVEHGPALTRETVIRGVSMLWPGESVEVVGDTIRFIPDCANEVVVPATLSNGARVTDALRELIAENLRPFVEIAQHPLVELSGGFDSGCVGVAASGLRDDILSYGLIHGGVVGRQQRARRREIIDILGFDDHEYLADNNLELASLEIEEAQVTSFDDNQRIPCAYGVETHPSGPVDLIMTGVGGDELCLEHTFRREEWQLPGSASSSSLTVAAGRSDMFLRRGIWPVNPLCSPDVIDFCRSLPRPLRANRAINVLMLARAGMSDGFIYPRFAEGYGHSMQREAAYFDFDAALDGSIVADLGFMDISQLLDQAHAASNGGFSYKLIGALFWLLKLERIYQRYLP